MIRHIGFTGTRRGLNLKQEVLLEVILKQLVKQYIEVILHHGDCLGADYEAHQMAEGLSLITVAHPPTSKARRAYCNASITLGPEPYLKRNKKIVNYTELMIAAPEGLERTRSGTWSTIRYARREGRTILILHPTGALEVDAPKEEGKGHPFTDTLPDIKEALV